MKRILSCSFGKDSLAMLLLCLEKKIKFDEVVFCDTGMEFDSTYKNRDKICKLLSKSGIKFTEIKPQESFLYSMLVRPVKYRNGTKNYPYHYGYEWCGGCARWGTKNKLVAIKKHYQTAYQNEKIIELVDMTKWDELKKTLIRNIH